MPKILRKKGLLWLFEVPEFESVFKIQVDPFSADLGTIFPLNLGVTLKLWVLQDLQALRRASRKLLHKDGGLSWKF